MTQMADSTVKSVATVLALAAGFALVPKALDAMKTQNTEAAHDFDASLMPSSARAQLVGDRVKLSALHGKPVLLDFTASWCPSCQRQGPIVDSIADRFQKDGLVIVGIDTNEKNKDFADYWVKKKSYHFPIVFDEDSKVAEAYGVDVMPTLVFISKDGRIAAVRHGITPPEEIASLVKRLL